MFRIENTRFWDRAARKYATSAIADTAGYERTLERTCHYLAGQDTAFEFGCGTGTTALRLAPFLERIVATDISSEMIAIAREKSKAEGCSNAVFEVATPDAETWPEDTFDIALGFNVLHLVETRDAALKAIHRLLKPGGLFISKTPCLMEMNPVVRLAVPVMQLAFLSAQDLESEITAAGSEIIEHARHGSRRRDPRPFLVARKQA